jgi:hypothetical protein
VRALYRHPHAGSAAPEDPESQRKLGEFRPAKGRRKKAAASARSTALPDTLRQETPGGPTHAPIGKAPTPTNTGTQGTSSPTSSADTMPETSRLIGIQGAAQQPARGAVTRRASGGPWQRVCRNNARPSSCAPMNPQRSAAFSSTSGDRADDQAGKHVPQLRRDHLAADRRAYQKDELAVTSSIVPPLDEDTTPARRAGLSTGRTFSA